MKENGSKSINGVFFKWSQYISDIKEKEIDGDKILINFYRGTK
jgi:hypothetical protein